MACIFIDQPPSCLICMDSRKLQCLLDHQHLQITLSGKAELAQLLKANCDSQERYKTKSGQEQRGVKNGQRGNMGNENEIP